MLAITCCFSHLKHATPAFAILHHCTPLVLHCALCYAFLFVQMPRTKRTARMNSSGRNHTTSRKTHTTVPTESEARWAASWAAHCEEEEARWEARTHARITEANNVATARATAAVEAAKAAGCTIGFGCHICVPPGWEQNFDVRLLNLHKPNRLAAMEDLAAGHCSPCSLVMRPDCPLGHQPSYMTKAEAEHFIHSFTP